MMYLKVESNKYYGETKEECLDALWKDPRPTSLEEKLMEETNTAASEYVFDNCYTDEEKESQDWDADLFGKYCTDEIILKCFEDVVAGNPIRYRGVHFGEEESEE